MGWMVAIGIDTHKRFHVAVALDRLGGQQGVLEFEASEHGYAQLLAFARALGEPVFVIEGTGSYGAGLTRYRSGAAGRQRTTGSTRNAPPGAWSRANGLPHREHTSPSASFCACCSQSGAAASRAACKHAASCKRHC
jgi:hypothetical protein